MLAFFGALLLIAVIAASMFHIGYFIAITPAGIITLIVSLFRKKHR